MVSRFSARSNFAPVLPLTEAEEAEQVPHDNGEGLPSPHVSKVSARRMAGLREAIDALHHLPAPGECLHVVCTARHDLTDTLAALITRQGAIQRMKIAT